MAGEQKKYHLVTRSDMDGLVCAVLLRQQGLIGEITFVHPKDVQDGKIELNENHITTNLPYHPAVHMSFDHHESELLRIREIKNNRFIDPHAPSAARVVYNHFGGKAVFPRVSEAMMAAVDKADSAQYTIEDVLKPKGWELLSFLMDARTGLGRFREFRVSNYTLMMDLIEYCQNHDIDDILALPDVKERVDMYFDQEELFKEQIKRCTTLHKNLGVLELRHEEVIHAGNRFMIYALFPEIEISMHVMWGRNRQNTVFAVGKSIFKRTSKVNIGPLMLEYGGGGHAGAGTCQVDNDRADHAKQELIQRLTE
ncbi:MAG TPA: exopolyphosphatase [Anaerolineaceae bacterium]|nr:exopolyphosphatase [Anaerolineaceae bacterium]HPN49944.1 exopolyphosphatase [Anaerolineaceae bacterium]